MSDLTQAKLQTLQPILVHLYTVFEEGIEWTNSVSKIEQRRIRLSKHGFSNLVRVYVCDRLQYQNTSQLPYEHISLLNDGIEVQCSGHSIKVIKLPKVRKASDDIFPLGGTYARMAWLAQNGELFELDEIVDIEELRNILVMWDVDEHLSLKTFLLLIPNIGEPPILIPHPATIERPQEPTNNETASDIPELGEDEGPQDLDEIDETGTEES